MQAKVQGTSTYFEFDTDLLASANERANAQKVSRNQASKPCFLVFSLYERGTYAEANVEGSTI